VTIQTSKQQNIDRMLIRQDMKAPDLVRDTSTRTGVEGYDRVWYVIDRTYDGL